MSRSPVCSGLMCEPHCINTNERVKGTEVLLKARRLGEKAAAICMPRRLYGVEKQKGLTQSKWEAADLSVLWKWCIIARTRFASASCGGLSINLSAHWKKEKSFDRRGPFCFWHAWHRDPLRICSFVTGVWIFCRLKLTKLILYFEFEEIHRVVLIRH